MKCLDIVKAGQHPGSAIGNVGTECREIGSHVAHQVDIHAEEPAVLRQRHARGGDIVASLRVTDEMIRPLGRPFDGLAKFFRGDRDQRVFAIGEQLGAESAADVGADHAHLFHRNLQHGAAENLAQPMAALTADRQRQAIVPGIVFADGGARLHVVGDDARIDDRDFRHRMRTGECGVSRILVTDRNVEQKIARVIGPDLRRFLLHGIGDTHHRGERPPLHLDRLERIARVLDGVGHHESNGVADVPHLVAGKDRIWRRGEGLVRKVELAGQAAEVCDVGRGEDQGNARQATGARRIDPVGRMGVRRAQHQRMQRTGRRMVVGIAALAANKRVVFLAPDALADAEFHGSHMISAVAGSLYRSGASPD